MDLDKHISKHFTYREMFKSSTADRRRIDNTTEDKQILENLTRVAEHILEPVRKQYMISFSPSSAYRCRDLNRILKSSDRSQHTKGEAVDIEIPTVDNFQLFKWIEYNLDFDQLILEFYVQNQPTSGWVHVSYVSPEKNRHKTNIFYKK